MPEFPNSTFPFCKEAAVPTRVMEETEALSGGDRAQRQDQECEAGKKRPSGSRGEDLP